MLHLNCTALSQSESSNFFHVCMRKEHIPRVTRVFQSTYIAEFQWQFFWGVMVVVIRGNKFRFICHECTSKWILFLSWLKWFFLRNCLLTFSPILPHMPHTGDLLNRGQENKTSIIKSNYFIYRLNECFYKNSPRFTAEQERSKLYYDIRYFNTGIINNFITWLS